MPTTGRYPLVQLNSIYLTKDGTSGGTPCRVTVDGLKELIADNAIQVIKSLSGKPYYQLSDVQSGLPIDISMESVEDSVYEDLVDAVNDFLADPSTPMTLSVTGAPYGDFSSLDVGPTDDPFDFDSQFSNTQVKNFTLHLITQ